MGERASVNVPLQNVLRRAERTKQRLLDDDIRAVARTQPGQRMLAWIIYSLCAVEEVGFDTHGSTMNLLAGRRSIGRDLLNKIRQLQVDLDLEIYRRRHEELTEATDTALAAKAQGEREDNDA